jgi:hypothetical protein
VAELEIEGPRRRLEEGRGVNGSLIKKFHKKPTYVPCSKLQTKTLKESDEKY